MPEIAFDPAKDPVVTVKELVTKTADPVYAVDAGVPTVIVMARVLTVTVIVIVAPLKFVLSVGVNVAVMTELPAPATVNVVPEILITDEAADEYTNEPGSDPATDGAVIVKFSSPKLLFTSLHVEKVGVALPIVKVSETCVAAA